MLTSYARVVRRRWYVLPIMIVLAALVLAFATNHWVTVTSRVIVPFPGDQNNQNFQSVATSTSVANLVIKDLNIQGESAGQLLGQVSVALEFNTNVYDISVRDTSAARATKIGNAWVKEATALYTKLNTAPAALAYIQAENQLGQMQQTINTLQNQITAFEYQHPELINIQTSTSSSSTSRNTTSTSGTSSSSSNANTSQASNGTGGAGLPSTGQSSASTSTSSSGTNSANSTGNSSNSTTSTTATNNTPGRMSDAQTLNSMRTQLTNDIFGYNQLAQVLSNTQLSALASQQLAFAQVLDTARVATPNMPLLLAFTLALGLLMGLGAIFVWEYFDHSVGESRTLEQVFQGVAVLPIATIPTRRELQHVATGTWAVPEPAAVASRPGMWPALLALAATTDVPVATIDRDGHDQGHANGRGNAAQAQHNGHTTHLHAHDTATDESNR